MPWEIIFKLANALSIPPWICVPAHADDDYVLQLATLAKSLLNPSLHLYLEWSNEVSVAGRGASLLWPFFHTHTHTHTHALPQRPPLQTAGTVRAAAALQCVLCLFTHRRASRRLPPFFLSRAGSFEQSHYALAAANASVYAGDPYHLNASGLVGDGNPGYWHARYYVAISKAHADIFAGVFGAGSVGKDARVRPVYAWQCGNMHEVGLDYMLQIYGEPSTTFHSMACAPYATIGDVANSPTLTPQQVLDGWRSYQQNISLAGPYGFGSVNYVAGMAATAGYFGLYFQAYESGPDTVQGLDAGQPLWAKGNASADPRIEPIVFDYLQAWHQYGQIAGPMNYFTLGAGPLDDRCSCFAPPPHKRPRPILAPSLRNLHTFRTFL